MPKQFNVGRLVFVNFDLNSRQFDVKLKGRYAGNTDEDTIELEDKQEAADLKTIRYILGKLPAAYGSGGPVAFTVAVDDNGDIVVPAGVIVSAGAPSPGMRVASSVPRMASPVPRAASPSLININSDDETSLKSLPGVGPATARLIVRNRPFKAVADLETVEGIGPAKMRDIRPLVTV